MRDLADIKLRKQDEHKCLDESHEQAQRHQHYGTPQYVMPGTRWAIVVEHFFVGKHIRKKTYAQCERTNQVADSSIEKINGAISGIGPAKCFK
jgi:hypothetical protein